MEYLKILDSAQRSFGQKKIYTIVFIAGGIGYMHQEDDNIVCTMEDLRQPCSQDVEQEERVPLREILTER